MDKIAVYDNEHEDKKKINSITGIRGMPNLDQEDPNETFASSYMAYGLFGVFVKWAKGGYMQTPEEMAKILITEIFKDYQIEGL